MKKFPWSITIDSVANGVIVGVGCQKLVYSEEMFELFINDLELYIRDFKKAEKMISERWDMKFGDDAEQPCETERPTVERVASRSSASEACHDLDNTAKEVKR